MVKIDESRCRADCRNGVARSVVHRLNHCWAEHDKEVSNSQTPGKVYR